MKPTPAAIIRFIRRCSDGNRSLAKLDRISFAKQLCEVYRLQRENGLEPHEYYRYELCRRELSWEQKRRYLSKNHAFLIHRTINPKFEYGLLQKMVAQRFFTAMGVRMPVLYGFYDRFSGHDVQGAPLQTRDQFVRLIETGAFTDFVLKAVGANRGEGVRVCRKLEGGEIFSSIDGEISLFQLFDKIAVTQYDENAGAVADSWLIQERVRQHPFLDRYTTDATQTARIVTYITRTGQIEVLMRLLKIARAGKYIDNVGTTGFAAPIDENGVLGEAAQITKTGIVHYAAHPETGAAIAGERLPYFREIMAMALTCQSLAPQLRSLGWDIAITQDGPVLLEGNIYWSQVLQFATGAGVMSQELSDELRQILQSEPR